MEKDDLDHIFEKLKGTFDTETPATGHQERFMAKLNASKGVVGITKKKTTWWRTLSIAASVAVLITVGIGLFDSQPSVDQQLAEISPEVSKSQFYFANLIADQVKQLESKSTPETQKIIDDTLFQLKKLEQDYGKMEQDLLNGGNSKLILSAMITNFQTRIGLLQDVLLKIETINELNNYNDENYTI
mgnify:CR=1 FL=1|tara:strand:+ start:1842 stop:2402 length:561 start_codon:yes stop_codon:yes gene_type:complete